MAERATVLGAHLPSLTGLRYLAATLVVIHHAAPVLAAGTWMERAARDGFVGVTFFFVLSGFVLTWSSSTPAGPGTFYRRRFARVYPLHVLTWGASLAASVLADDEEAMVAIVLTLLLLQAWVPVEDVYFGVNTPSWSLSCEAFFYAVFPLIARRGPKLADRPAWLIPAVLVVTVVGVGYSLSPLYSYWVAYINPLYRLGEFVVGILLAAALRQSTSLRITTPVALLALVASYALCSMLSGERPGLQDALMLPSVVLIIAAAAAADLAGKSTMWASHSFQRLGQWSPALYLINYAAVRLVSRLVGDPLEPGAVIGSLLMAAWLAVLTVGSWLAFRFIERPLERRIRGGRRTHARRPALRG